jgi:hypothetical protein
MSKSSTETTEPHIFITVSRTISGHSVNSMREISFDLWRAGKFSGHIFDAEINAMMKEVHYGN